MAVLSAADRARVSQFFQRLDDDVLGTCSFTKAQLAAAIADTDDWIDSNQTSFNNSLPAAFRNAATTQQKTVLFCFVALRRAGLTSIGEVG